MIRNKMSKAIGILFALALVVFSSPVTLAAPQGPVNAAPAEESYIASENTVLIYHDFVSPETLEIGEGDIVILKNAYRPKQTLLLTGEGIGETRTLPYGRTLALAFEKEGTYNFRVENMPGLAGNIIVKKEMPDIEAAVVENSFIEMAAPAKGAETGDKAVKVVSRSQTLVEKPAATQDSSTGNLFLLTGNTLRPEALTVRAGETVTWKHINKPMKPFVLVSEDGLWENAPLSYGKSFTCTFDKPGTYAFGIEGEDGMKGTVTVK